MAVRLSDVAERVIVLATEKNDWATTLRDNLAELGFNIKVFDTCAEIDDSVLDKTLDAIIAVHTPENMAFFVKLRQDTPQTALLVLVVDELSALQDASIHASDVVLPKVMPYLENQLRNLLAITKNNHRQVAQNDDLKQRIQILEHDIQREKTMNVEVELLKNAIIHNVSHELRTPLLHVKSAVAMISDTLKDLPQERKVFEYAEEATARLELLVKNITMLGSSLEYNPSPIIMRDVIESARRTLGRVWQRKGDIERLTTQLEQGLPPVNADKQGLATVLQLLIDNALKFSEQSQREVIVSAKRDGQHVIISVQDFGIGIAPEQLENIFKSFYQVDSSSTRKYGGAGVGLAIVKIILEHHSANITVVSTLGAGTTFSFNLPIVDLSA
jgi:signal transduction histidine kinase